MDIKRKVGELYGKFLEIDEKTRYTRGIYLLQFLGIFTLYLSLIVSGFLAYLKHDDTVGFMENSHIKWQITTFWVALGGLVSGVLLSFIFIGKIIFLLTQLWLFYRSIKGIYLLLNQQEIDNSKLY